MVCDMSETLPVRLDRMMRDAGYNPRSLSLAASLGVTAVRDIIEGRIASPRYATLQALAAVLGVGVAQLAGAEDAGAEVEPARQSGGEQRDMPVYGAALGGSGGAMVVSSDAIQYMARPDPLIAVRGGYGVFVTGESMSPAYEQGDIALVHPSAPPRRNCDVILTRTDADGTRHVLIKRLIGWGPGYWRVRQYNPAKDFDLSQDEWTEVHAIVGKYNVR
jgi:phage repressor protein C with HTH and peptisase S24 domain